MWTRPKDQTCGPLQLRLTVMAAVSFLLLLCPALASQQTSISGLSCVYNYNQIVRCEWATNRTDECSLQARTVNYQKLRYFRNFNSSCVMEMTEKPRLRRCSLQFKKTDTISYITVLSLKLSCDMSQVPDYSPMSHVKLDALGKPTVNGSSVSWLKAELSKDKDVQYEIHWRPPHRPWAVDPGSSKQLFQCSMVLDDLTLGQEYRARVRSRVSAPEWSEWSDWSPTLSWVSAVGRSPTAMKYGSEGAGTHGPGTWATVCALMLFLGLVIVLWKSRMHQVVMMKAVDGAPGISPFPSVLKMGWQPPLFSSDSYWSSLKHQETIAPVELLPAEPMSEPYCHLPPEEDPSSSSKSLSFSQSNFSNPMYSKLSLQQAPLPDHELLPECSDPLEDSGPACIPELDVMRLLTEAAQSQGVLVVCDYESVEAVGAQGPSGDRVRLTSVDSGVGSGEDVSQDSVLLEDHTTAGTAAGELCPTVPTA